MARTKRKVNPLKAAMPLETSVSLEAKQGRIYHVGGYVRLSVKNGRKEKADTIQNQKELILKYVEAQPDMEFVRMYCDNGRTGTNFKRPGYERLLQDVKSGYLDCIVVKDLSRFGRSYLEAGNYLERVFPFLGVRFVAIADSFDTLTVGKGGIDYLVPLKNILNEFYSRDISRKIGSALAVKQQKGEFIGTWAAYGYKKCADNPHRIEPDEETALVVQEIFRQCLLGKSYVQIAEILNERGIPSPSRYRYLKGEGKAERYANAVWKPPVIKNILSSEVYLGHMVQRRKRQSFYEGKKQQVLPEDEWVIVRDTHEAIIDEKIFRAVQKLMGEKKLAYKKQRKGNKTPPPAM